MLLRADNNGEGGTLTLMALARRVSAHGATILYFGIIGASLFFGDALITPAISVLSAIEGVKVATSGFDHYVVPLTVLILVFLFAVQSRGTASVAAWFGPNGLKAASTPGSARRLLSPATPITANQTAPGW